MPAAIYGKAAYEALKPSAGRALIGASITGAVFGAAWKYYHWTCLRAVHEANSAWDKKKAAMVAGK